MHTVVNCSVVELERFRCALVRPPHVGEDYRAKKHVFGQHLLYGGFVARFDYHCEETTFIGALYTAHYPRPIDRLSAAILPFSKLRFVHFDNHTWPSYLRPCFAQLSARHLPK